MLPTVDEYTERLPTNVPNRGEVSGCSYVNRAAALTSVARVPGIWLLSST